MAAICLQLFVNKVSITSIQHVSLNLTFRYFSCKLCDMPRFGNYGQAIVSIQICVASFKFRGASRIFLKGGGGGGWCTTTEWGS